VRVDHAAVSSWHTTDALGVAKIRPLANLCYSIRNDEEYAVSVTVLPPAAITLPCKRCGLYHAAGAVCPVALDLPARAADRTLAPGTLLGGRFEIVQVAHRSGMSTVYRARENGSTPVAVKQFSAAGLNDEVKAEYLRWLAREAGLLSSLHHPGLPMLIAAFSEGDDHFVVMPYLDGETVKELVGRDGPLPENAVLRCALALAEILAYLHSQDPPIIHRDLKPDNILILSSGKPVANLVDRRLILLDLGVAHPLSRGSVGTAIGTPGYAAPEQYQGLADERTDLYALGATLHYMLTGYDAERSAPFRHPPLRELCPDLSPGMDALVTTLLQLVPNERPAAADRVQQYAEQCVRCVEESREFDLALELAGKAIIRARALVAGTAIYALGWAVVGQTSWMDSSLARHPWGLVLYAFAWAVGMTGVENWQRHRHADDLTKRAQKRLNEAWKIRMQHTIGIVGCLLLCLALLAASALAAPAVAGLCIYVFCVTACAVNIPLAYASRSALRRMVKQMRLHVDEHLGAPFQLCE